MTIHMTVHVGIRGLVIAAALAGAAAAYAHAHLDLAQPAAGATLAAAPTDATPHFTQQLEPTSSTSVVRDAAGKQVDKGDSHVNEEAPAVLKVSLQPLGSGSYKVEWARDLGRHPFDQGRVYLSRRQLGSPRVRRTSPPGRDGVGDPLIF